MKKLVLIALLVFCFSSTAFAQLAKGDMEVGLSIGFNLSNVATDAVIIPDYATGINIAGSLDYYFSNRWSIRAKLIYGQKGWSENLDYYYDPFNPNIYAENLEYNLNYLTIPVMANWHFAKKRNWYLNFGPYVGFLLNAEEVNRNIDVKGDLNSTDFGLAYGIGVKIPVSTQFKIIIETDTQIGFVNILKNNYNTAINTRGSINVGVNYQLGK